MAVDRYAAAFNLPDPVLSPYELEAARRLAHGSPGMLPLQLAVLRARSKIPFGRNPIADMTHIEVMKFLYFVNRPLDREHGK